MGGDDLVMKKPNMMLHKTATLNRMAIDFVLLIERPGTARPGVRQPAELTASVWRVATLIVIG
jgi:hypothetical protein